MKLLDQQNKDPEFSKMAELALTEHGVSDVPMGYYKKSGVLMRKLRPPEGVAAQSDFEQCFEGTSCLGHTIFKDDKHTGISLGSSVFNLLMNGDPYTVPVIGAEQVRCSSKIHSVLAWRNGQCTMLLGSSKLMLQHCRHRLDV
ncbi:putative Mucin-5B-like 4 [Homarus americanus]|uniref:Putative Mucin-5B-like 4 n=1 Tax=Homarus americanus TaxID=6706 RepID=A0A8J5NC51_HOMAM|nr:putative Mucin-5B-like 4 [Homarus americanus]